MADVEMVPRMTDISDRSLTVAIVEAIADVEGVDPSDLDFALSEYLNPAVLDALDRDGRGEWEIDFVVEAHLVTLDSDGHLVVDGHPYRIA